MGNKRLKDGSGWTVGSTTLFPLVSQGLCDCDERRTTCCRLCTRSYFECGIKFLNIGQVLAQCLMSIKYTRQSAPQEWIKLSEVPIYRTVIDLVSEIASTCEGECALWCIGCNKLIEASKDDPSFSAT